MNPTSMSVSTIFSIFAFPPAHPEASSPITLDGLHRCFSRPRSRVTKPSTQKPPTLSLAEVPEIDRCEPSRSVLRSCKMKRNAAETGSYMVHCKSRKRFGKKLQQLAWPYHLLRFAVQAQVACIEAAPVLRPRPLHLQQRIPTSKLNSVARVQS